MALLAVLGHGGGTTSAGAWAGRLRPDRDVARQWVVEELARDDYQPTWWERMQQWLGELFAVPAGGGTGAGTVAVVVVSVALASLTAYLLARSWRRRRAAGRLAGGSVLDRPWLTAAELRRSAQRAWAAQDYDTAVVEGFRALAATAAERGHGADAPSRTAHEVAAALGQAFPARARAYQDAGRWFDQVRYGGRRAARDQARQILDLGEQLTREPRPPGAAAEAPSAAAR
jgi:hypothetical protein